MKKHKLLLPEKNSQSTIRVGSQVVAIDGSYTLSILNSQLKHIAFGLVDNIQTVIATNVNCPTDYTNLNDTLTYGNNCIVQDNESGVITFCSNLNIRNIRHLGEIEPYKLNNPYGTI